MTLQDLIDHEMPAHVERETVDKEIATPIVKELPVPAKPAADEVRRHELNHEPYAPWCSSCVAGRGRAKPHKYVSPFDRDEAIIQMDYHFWPLDPSHEMARTLRRRPRSQPCASRPAWCSRRSSTARATGRSARRS